MKNTSLDRFTVCLEKGLLARLDGISAERGYPSRSQAVADFIRRAIVKKDWQGGRACAGTVSIVYDPSDPRPGRGLERLLRSGAGSVLSVQTNLLPGGKMLATASVTGQPAALQRLADAMRALKGVTHGSFSIIAPLGGK
ncbi:MAG: CopG family ribbon-helix-helix protein [Elusimicrobia bacterium]|nr:CopG family ribbon-helix-helix protein [Elusimicrobiota bacterium]